MSGIAHDIDGVIVHQLKLHHTTTDDLLCHVADKLTTKYPEADFTIPGIVSRLHLLEEQFKIEQTQINNRIVWKLYGDNITIPNRVWRIISSLSKLECHIQSITYTIRKRYPSITSSEIKNAIGILQSNRIIQIRNNVASASISEKQYLTQEMIL